MKATSGIEKNISTQKSLNTTSGVKRLTFKEFDNLRNARSRGQISLYCEYA